LFSLSVLSLIPYIIVPPAEFAIAETSLEISFLFASVFSKAPAPLYSRLKHSCS